MGKSLVSCCVTHGVDAEMTGLTDIVKNKKRQQMYRNERSACQKSGSLPRPTRQTR